MSDKVSSIHHTSDDRGPYNLSNILFEDFYNTIVSSFPKGLMRHMTLDNREKGEHMAWPMELGEEIPSKDKRVLEIMYDKSKNNKLEVTVQEGLGITYSMIEARIGRYERRWSASVDARQAGQK